MDTFETFVRSGLELADTPVDETDLTIMRVADAVYGSRLRELMAEDLSEVKPEVRFDPSRAPQS